MSKRIYTLLFLLATSATFMFAQSDAWTKTGIADELTVNPEQNKMWKMGESQFPAAPKDAWELGVHLGHYTINGDLPTLYPAGFGVGLHVRNAINYVFSWRLEGMYAQTRGIDGRLSNPRVLRLDNQSMKGIQNSQYRNFKAKNLSGAISVIGNVGNLLFHKPSNKWNFYVGVGLGLTTTDVKVNFKNGDTEYDWTQFEKDQGRENTRAKRQAIWDALDSSWETATDNDRNVPVGFNDDSNLFPSFVGTIGLSRKINRRINVSLEHQVYAQDYDKLDGFEWREADTADGGGDQTNDSDMIHYTNLRVGINLGNLDKRTEPMYWLNPLDATYNSIAELKRRPILDLTDSDGDGVIDMMDKEPNTPSGCAVDVRGVTLDSDMDGIPDCKDKEPYSPAGYEIDSEGVHIPKPTLTESDVNTIIDGRVPGMISTATAKVKSTCGEWFLPMIHFDLDRYNIKPEFYGELHHVAEVMRLCPSACISVVGHTDERNKNAYNDVLSYNRANAAVDYLVSTYGIDRSRFNVMYGGEDKPLVASPKTEAQQYMNRRVEFRICKTGDSTMSRPAGPNAGKGGRSTGSTYSGNKNSGY